MNKKKIFIIIFFFIGIIQINCYAFYLLIYMDENQTNHLKSYGTIFNYLKDNIGTEAYWLLNYRGGSFVLEDNLQARNLCLKQETAYTSISKSELSEIEKQIDQNNMYKVKLEKAPRVAVYIPPTNSPWDDAVSMALEYAGVKYDKIYDEDILNDKLSEYDWLHLHHEDFTGQYDKFYASYKDAAWYLKKVKTFVFEANRLGYKTVAEEKLAVAKKIKEFVLNGGFLFAMCSATDSIDIALATEGLDIIAPEIDGTPLTAGFEKKIDYSKTLAFKDFKIYTDAYFNPRSDIDAIWANTPMRKVAKDFELFDFSAKFDPLPTILTQNHTRIVKGFYGLTSSFNLYTIKDDVIIMGKVLGEEQAKYIYAPRGKGFFTFYGGHDPEDYQHAVGESPTNLNLHKNSPGYRLILNNLLFPAAKKEKLKT